MRVFYPLLRYESKLKLYLAYEENLNPLSSAIVFFQVKIRSEIPETSIKKENGKKRCFPKRTGDQEPPELFKRIVSIKDKGNRLCKPAYELKKNRHRRFFLH
jgi:hypothetical protein